MNTQTQIEDLWPSDIAEQTTVTPLAILREQASLLGKKTRNLVEGRVRTESGEANNGKSRIYHTFTLVVPALDDYSYELFQINHPVTLYPVDVISNAAAINFYAAIRSLKDEEEFKGWLREVFASPHTKRVLGALIAQAAA